MKRSLLSSGRELKPDYSRRTTTSAMPCWNRVRWMMPSPVSGGPWRLSQTTPRPTTTWALLCGSRASSSDATAARRRALELKPDYPEAHNRCRRRSQGPRDVRRGRGLWRRALELKPESTETHSNLGMALEAKGTRRSHGLVPAGLEIKPDYAEAYNNLANALWERANLPRPKPVGVEPSN